MSNFSSEIWLFFYSSKTFFIILRKVFSQPYLGVTKSSFFQQFHFRRHLLSYFEVTKFVFFEQVSCSISNKYKLLLVKLGCKFKAVNFTVNFQSEICAKTAENTSKHFQYFKKLPKSIFSNTDSFKILPAIVLKLIYLDWGYKKPLKLFVGKR